MPKITELAAQTAITDTDLLIFVDDVEGTPTTYKISFSDLKGSVFSRLKLPNVTTAQMNAIASPEKGMLVYNTTADSIYQYKTGWEVLAAGGGGGGATALDGLTDVVVTAPAQYHVLAYDHIEEVWKNRQLTPDDISGLQAILDGKQPVNTNLTVISGLLSTATNVIQSVGGTWASRTPAQLKATLALVKGDVGLGNADNTSDVNKPVSTAQQAALNGKADLVDGYVPASQLPSYVDDVLEVANYAALPETGESGKIYITQDDNKTYRWSGTGYAIISDTLALGETSATAYRGDKGKTAYDHSLITTGNPHSVTKGEVGLGNADNTSDADKPVSTPQAAALALKADVTALSAHTTDTGNPHSVTKAQVGLGNVDNTSDNNKPVSTAQQAALDAKATKGADATISPTVGVGEYQTVGASIAANKWSIIARRGTYAESANLAALVAIAQTAINITGEDRENTVITLAADVNGFFKIVGDGSTYQNVTFVIPDVALANATTGWIYVDAMNVHLLNCRFLFNQTANRQGCGIYVKSTSHGFRMRGCHAFTATGMRLTAGFVVIDGAQNYEVESNQIIAGANMTGDLIKIAGTASTNGQIKKNLLVASSSTNGITFGTASHTDVDGNIIRISCVDSSKRGIYGNTLNNSSVKNNIIDVSNGIGIKFDVSEYNTDFDNNNVISGDLVCLALTAPSHVRIRKNSLYNSTSYNGCVTIDGANPYFKMTDNALRGGGNGPMVIVATTGTGYGLITGNSWGNRTAGDCISDQSNGNCSLVVDNPQPVKFVTATTASTALNMNFYTHFRVIVGAATTVTFTDASNMSLKPHGLKYEMVFYGNFQTDLIMPDSNTIEWIDGKPTGKIDGGEVIKCTLFYDKTLTKYYGTWKSTYDRSVRFSSVTSAATITPTCKLSTVYAVTALAADATVAAPSGVPTDGQELTLRIKDAGTGKNLTWNAIYRPIGVTLPASTTAGKTMYLRAMYNGADSKWDVISVQVEA